PSQMGLLTELFRRRRGVLRSLHPTHSVCAHGPLASEITRSHHLSSAAFGEISPFGVMARHRTTILGLGTEYYRSLTQVHAIEDHMGAKFPIAREGEEPLSVILVDSEGHHITYKMDPELSKRFIVKIERLAKYIDPGILREWKYRGTPFYVVGALEINKALENA